MYNSSLNILPTLGDFFKKRNGNCCYFKYTVSRTTFSQKVISIVSLEKAESEVAQTNQSEQSCVLFKVVSINFTHSAVSNPEPCWLCFDLAEAVFYS